MNALFPFAAAIALLHSGQAPSHADGSTAPPWACTTNDITNGGISAHGMRLLWRDGSMQSELIEWKWTTSQNEIEVSMGQWLGKNMQLEDKILVFVNVPDPRNRRLAAVALRIDDGTPLPNQPDYIDRRLHEPQYSLAPPLDFMRKLAARHRKAFVVGTDIDGTEAFRIPLDLAAIERGRDMAAETTGRVDTMAQNFARDCRWQGRR